MIDFGAVEVQTVCVSGDLRRPFEYYMEDPEGYCSMQWAGRLDGLWPDCLYSLQQRLTPQLIYRRTLDNWGKRTAIVADRSFFDSLLPVPKVNLDEGKIAWLIYDLVLNSEQNQYELIRHQTAYAVFPLAMDSLAKAKADPVEDFVRRLDAALEEVVVSDD